MKFKVLSLLQPWASLVVLGHKRIETRSWNTKYRGPLLVHASSGKAYKRLDASDPLYRFYHPLLAHDKMQPIEQLPYGAIIGMVQLKDIAHTHFYTVNDAFYPEPRIVPCNGTTRLGLTSQEYAFGNYSAGRYGWLLTDAVTFQTPVPAKGKLGLWEPPADVMAKVREQIDLAKKMQR